MFFIFSKESPLETTSIALCLIACFQRGFVERFTYWSQLLSYFFEGSFYPFPLKKKDIVNLKFIK